MCCTSQLESFLLESGCREEISTILEILNGYLGKYWSSADLRFAFLSQYIADFPSLSNYALLGDYCFTSRK
ncbi:MAG: hypothetical protein RLZZ507_2941 [Cyanobacteriota bacterium]|jgi:hypothetical protein